MMGRGYDPEFIRPDGRVNGRSGCLLSGGSLTAVKGSPKHGALRSVMKKTTVVRNYYVLPCCLLLLNLVNNIVAYKSEEIGEPLLRTAAVIFLVLAGSALVAFFLAPAITKVVQSLQVGSRRGAGELGEVIFLVLLGAAVFWLYYRVTIHGVASILPDDWRNPRR